MARLRQCHSSLFHTQGPSDRQHVQMASVRTNRVPVPPESSSVGDFVAVADKAVFLTPVAIIVQRMRRSGRFGRTRVLHGQSCSTRVQRRRRQSVDQRHRHRYGRSVGWGRAPEALGDRAHAVWRFPADRRSTLVSLLKRRRFRQTWSSNEERGSAGCASRERTRNARTLIRLVVREGTESLVRAGCLPCPWVCNEVVREERFHVQVGFAQVIARVIVDSVFSLRKTKKRQPRQVFRQLMMLASGVAFGVSWRVQGLARKPVTDGEVPVW